MPLSLRLAFYKGILSTLHSRTTKGIPIHLGGFSPNTFSRIAKYANGWLGSAGGSLEYLANGIKMLSDQAVKSNRNSNELKIATLAFPQIDTSPPTKQANTTNQRVPLSGTIEEVGDDLRKIKQMGVDHMIFGFMRMDSKEVIETVKQLSRFLM